MDILTRFWPLVTAVAQAADALRLGGTDGPDDVWRDLDAMAAQMLAGRSADDIAAGDIDTAWFAVAAWMDEALGWQLSDHERAAWRVSRGLAGAEPGTEFFTRLEAALADNNGRVVAVYAACLDLGYRGGAADVAGYRARCRALLADTTAPVAGFMQNRPASAPSKSRFSGVAGLAWLVPATVTLGLFCLYRYLLTGMVEQVLAP